MSRSAKTSDDEVMGDGSGVVDEPVTDDVETEPSVEPQYRIAGVRPDERRRRCIPFDTSFHEELAEAGALTIRLDRHAA